MLPKGGQGEHICVWEGNTCVRGHERYKRINRICVYVSTHVWKCEHIYERLCKGGECMCVYVCVYMEGSVPSTLLTSARCQTDGPPLPCQGCGPESYAPAAFSPPGRLLGG